MTFSAGTGGTTSSRERVVIRGGTPRSIRIRHRAAIGIEALFEALNSLRQGEDGACFILGVGMVKLPAVIRKKSPRDGGPAVAQVFRAVLQDCREKLFSSATARNVSS